MLHSAFQCYTEVTSSSFWHLFDSTGHTLHSLAVGQSRDATGLATQLIFSLTGFQCNSCGIRMSMDSHSLGYVFTRMLVCIIDEIAERVGSSIL